MSTKKKNRNRVSLRICIACGKSHPKSEMLRVLVSEDGDKVDTSGKLRGRGAYVCRKKDCIDKALSEKHITGEIHDSMLSELEAFKWNMIGIAAKAGKTVSGEFAAEEAITGGKAEFVIIAMDASDNTKKKFENKCAFYNVPYTVAGTKENLGKRVGHEHRSVAAVIDAGLALEIKKLFNED